MAKVPSPRESRKSSKKRYADISDNTETPSKRLASITAGMVLNEPSESNALVGEIPLRSSREPEANPAANAIDPGLDVLGKHVNKLVDLIKTLRDNGIDRLAIDLPQIVVVGDQSTGKSSLIEGLSGIKVPRHEGTCTRCPIEINMKATETTWRCSISIVKKYGKDTSTSNVGSALGLGPYNVKLQEITVVPFAEVTNKHEIPEWLRRAQLAVLNPGEPCQHFAVPLTQDIGYPAATESFSPNVIRMDIFAPGLPSLSFFDLPGVIVQDSDSELHAPKLIRNLVKSYVRSSKSLVLLTVPTDCDRANSQAAGLVSEMGAEGRTVGIVSKPDRLASANVNQWREILSGEKFRFDLGYRVVRNPPDPRVDCVEARRQEREFFENDYNFRVHLREFKNQFGTERLQVFLSEHLITMIKDCLPDIQQKVIERVAVIDEELSTLPKPPSGNVVFQIQHRIHDFEALVKAVITNSVDRNSSEILAKTKAASWFQEWHRRAQVFYEQLVQSAPQLQLGGFRQPVSTGKITENETIVLDEDDEVRPTAPRPMQHRQDPTLQSSTAPAMQPTLNSRDIKNIRAFVNKSIKKFTIDQLQTYVHTYNSGVHGIGDPRVFETLVKESTTAWPSCITQFLEQTGWACQSMVDDLLSNLFVDLKDTKLLEVIKQSALALVRTLHGREREFLGFLLNLETRSPLTLNHEEQETAKHTILAELVKQIQDAKIKCELAKCEQSNGRVTAADEKRIKETVRNDPNQNRQELIELAGAIAYYRIAARRVADYTALSMRNSYFHGLTNIHANLCEDLGISLESDTGLDRTNKKLKELMAPPIANIARRRQLERELKVLEHTEQNIRNVLDDPTNIKQEIMVQGRDDNEMQE